jgi:hypothetical protein
MRTLDDVLAEFPVEDRAEIAGRTRQIIAEEMALLATTSELGAIGSQPRR